MQLKCDFGRVLWERWIRNEVLTPKYTCVVHTSPVVKQNTVITSIKGAHLPGKTNSDVQAIIFMSKTAHFVPKGLNEFFPNLIAMKIVDCGLKSISREDLEGLENLSMMFLNNNELMSLPNDLFAKMPKLQMISMRANKLEVITSQVFKPILKNPVEFIDLRQNTKINILFQEGMDGSVGYLADLMAIVDATCSKAAGIKSNTQPLNFAQKLVTGNAELWKTGRFSDLTIIVGTKQFRVHKSVLAMQNSFFADMLKLDNEHPLTELEIREFKASTVETVLGYLYTGVIQVGVEKEDVIEVPDEEDVIETFAMSLKYKVLELTMFMEGKIREILDQSNAVALLDLAHLYNLDEIKTLAFMEIKKMLPAAKLADGLINKPENVKNLVEAHQTLKRKHQEAFDDYNLIWQKYNQ